MNLNVVDKICEFLRKKSAETIDPLPRISVITRLHYWKTFTSPNPDVYATIFNEEGAQVGRATYAVSPFLDRVYVFEIDVACEHRRKGFATALLRYLSQTYGRPITAIKELDSAHAFWDRARRLKKQGIIVTTELAVSDMGNESLRWRQVFQADIARLEQAISERLLSRQEPWNIAVGRGLE